MMHKKLLLSYFLIVLLNSTFLSENEDLENKCFDIFLKKRDENDYDFVKIKNAHICVNIDLYDQLKIKSDEVIYEQSGMLRFENDVQIEYFDKANNKVATLSANKALFSISKKILLVKGYVEIKTYDNDPKIVNTDILFFDQTGKICFNNSFLNIFAKNIFANGKNIYGKDDLSYYNIKNPKIVYNNADYKK